MGDGVRNGAEDEVLSVGWLGRSRREERDGGERERERRTVKKRVRKEPNRG